MPKYEVTTRFVFEGKFIVKAANRSEAYDNVQKHCGLVIGGNIHSSLPDDDIDWSFPVHPLKQQVIKIINADHGNRKV